MHERRVPALGPADLAIDRDEPVTPRRATRSASGPGRSERIVDAAEHRGLAVARTDIHVADDEGTRHAAHAEPRGGVQFREGAGAEICKHLAGIDERGHLQAHVAAEGVQARDARAQLYAGREHIAVDEAIGAVATQRLALGGHAAGTAEARESPEPRVARRR